MSDLVVRTDIERLAVVLERELPAPAGAVWQAWTDPARLEAWWGPAGWLTTVLALDLRPGGLWHFRMAPADGSSEAVWVRAIFTEIIPEVSVSYVEGFSDESATDLDPEPHSVTVDFIGVDAGRTRLVLSTRFPSAGRLEAAASMGMEQGWREGLDALDSYLKETLS